MNLVIHTKNIYQASNTTTGLIMAVAAIGIALGCWVAGKISGNEPKKGLILIGIGSMRLLLFVLTFFSLNFYLYAVIVFSIAFMGGFFQVPSLAIVQQSKLERKLGDMVAYLNMVTFIFVLFGTFLFWLDVSLITFLTLESSFCFNGETSISSKSVLRSNISRCLTSETGISSFLEITCISLPSNSSLFAILKAAGSIILVC